MDAIYAKNKHTPLQNPFTVIRILEYLPHGDIIKQYRRINKYFNDAIQGLDLFYDYTLQLECGRRGSVVGRNGRYLSSGGRQSSKNSEVVINDEKRSILISSSNSPLKSQRVAAALSYICKTTKINKVHFKSYRMSTTSEKLLMPPPDTLISPTNSADSKPDAEANITFTALPQMLPNIQEESSEQIPSDEEELLNGFQQENVDASSMANLIRPPPSPASRSSSSARSVFSASPCLSSSGPSRSDIRLSSKRLLSPTPSSPSSTFATIGTEVIELSFPSSHTTQLSGVSDVGSNIGSSRGSAVYTVNQTGFAALLDILSLVNST